MLHIFNTFRTFRIGHSYYNQYHNKLLRHRDKAMPMSTSGHIQHTTPTNMGHCFDAFS